MPAKQQQVIDRPTRLLDKMDEIQLPLMAAMMA
jgi:hypothetical protein